MSKTPGRISIIPIKEFPLIEKGDDLVHIILAALGQSGEVLRENDIIVISHKIVSKSEGMTVNLNKIIPSKEALALAEEVGKDPRVVHLILEESGRIVRKRYGLLIAEHRNGWICANAGVDYSNVPGDHAAMLPGDPDGTAAAIRERIQDSAKVDLSVIICDSQGRPFRNGVLGVALGCAGMRGLISKKGERDLYGYKLRNTEIALADQVASAALLVMGEADEGVPAAIIRGLSVSCKNGNGKELIRSKEKDLFI